MWRHYVYIHYATDNGEPFYVGKGSRRLRDKGCQFERACATFPRNLAWRRTVLSRGLRIEIIAMCRTDVAAQELEMRLIAQFGRIDLGTGPLVNVTDGGDGHAGLVASEELRRKRSQNAKGPRSKAWVASIRIARKNGGNGGVVKRGDKLSENWRRNLATGKLGERNPWFGKPSPVSRKVRNTETGATYDSIARAAAAEGISAKVLYQYLDGTRRNKTALARL